MSLHLHHDRRANPLTEEQLDLIADETERAVGKALRKYRNQAVAGFLVLAVGIGGAFAASSHDQVVSRGAIINSGSVVAVDSCNGRFNDRMALRDLFVRLQTAVYAQAKTEHLQPDSPQVKFAVQFYKDELQRLPLPDCRPVAHILTDQPFPPAQIPTPRHP